MDTPTVGHNPEGTMVWVIFDDVTLMLPRQKAEAMLTKLSSVLFDLFITEMGGDVSEGDDPDEVRYF